MSYCGERGVLVRLEEGTNPQWGTRPEDRPAQTYIKYGFTILDKPRGPTSHETIAWLKRILGVGRAGHAGTLDPGVSGVLPVAIEESTKVLQALSHADKVYVAVVKFHGDVSAEEVERALGLFNGREIYQRPPLRSAVKRSLRRKTVYSIQLLELDGKYALIQAHVESGTYMRKLVHDIGEILGVSANMRELRRIKVACFDESEGTTLQEINDAVYVWRNYDDDTYLRQVIKPVEHMARHLPKVWVRDSAVDAICHGAPLAVPGIAKLEERITPGSLVAMMTLKGELIALGRAQMRSEEMLKAQKGIAVRTTRVLMRSNTYPPIWRKLKEQRAVQEGAQEG